MKKFLKIFYVAIVLSITLIGTVVFFYYTERKDGLKLNNSSKDVKIVIYDKDSNAIYDKYSSTKKKLLIDVLKEVDEIVLITEDSQYGEYIVSINGYEQGDNYYWNYYINGEYAQVGISNYEVKDRDIITFKLEKYE